MAELSFAIAVINDGSGNYESHAIATPAVRASGGTRLNTEPWISNATQTEAALSLTNATNATPIVITVTNHGYSNGDVVVTSNISGNTNANGGPFIVESSTANTFALQDSVGTAPWTNATQGYVRRIVRTKNIYDAMMAAVQAVQNYKAAGN
jgi:hypothetical protein